MDMGMRQPFRVIVADDQLLVRAGIVALLEQLGEFECVGAAADGQAALALCRQHMPDVLLLDLHMPGMPGIEVLRALSGGPSVCRAVVLSCETEAPAVRATLAAGARGFVSKDFVLDELAMALKVVTDGRLYISPELAARMTTSPPAESSPLTPRQRDVLKGIADGHSNKEIARLLGVSLKTVEYHRSELIQRLDLHDVASLTRYAIEHRVVA